MVENRRKIDTKGVEKSDGKRVVAKMGQESQSESWNVRDGRVLDPRGGPLLSWRVNPPLAGPGLSAQIPAVRLDVLAGLD